MTDYPEHLTDEPKYSEEDIRKALANELYGPGRTADKIDAAIDALNRPKPVFEQGQVLSVGSGRYGVVDGNTATAGVMSVHLSVCRPLNLTELGPAVRDLVEGVDIAADRHITPPPITHYLQDLLAAFHEAHGEESND